MEEGPSLETSIFPFIVSDSERTFTFRVSLNTLPTLATLVRDTSQVIMLANDMPHGTGISLMTKRGYSDANLGWNEMHHFVLGMLWKK